MVREEDSEEPPGNNALAGRPWAERLRGVVSVERQHVPNGRLLTSCTGTSSFDGPAEGVR